VRFGRRPADEDAIRRRTERGRHVVVAQAVDGRRSPLAAGLDGQRHGGDGDPRSALEAQGAGGEVTIGGEPGAQPGQALLDAVIVAGAVDDDGDRVGRAAGEVALQREQALLRDGVVRQRRRPRGAHLQPQDR